MVNKTGNIKLRARKRFKLSPKIVIFVVLGVLIAALAGVAVWQALRNNDYHEQVNRYASDTKKALDAAKTDIEKLLQGSDVSATATAMTGFASTFEKKTQVTLSEPRLLGFGVGTSADYAKQTAIAAKAKTYVAALRDAASFLDYQVAVSMPLQELVLKSGTNYDQLNELAGAWAKALDAIQKTTPPKAAAGAHAVLVQKVSAVAGSVAKLPDLYKKIDIAGFNAAKKEMTAAIADLQAIGAQFTGLATTYDATLTTARAALNNL